MVVKPTDKNGCFERNQYGGGARVKRTGFPEQFAKELVKQSGDKLLMPQEEKKD
jgi:hypothetical protein